MRCVFVIIAAQLATSTFDQPGEYANSPGDRADCYAELAVEDSL